MRDEAANVLDRLDGNIEIGELGLWKGKPCVGLAHPVASAQVPGEQLPAFGRACGFGFNCGTLRSVITCASVVQRALEEVYWRTLPPKAIHVSCRPTWSIGATGNDKKWNMMFVWQIFLPLHSSTEQNTIEELLTAVVSDQRRRRQEGERGADDGVGHQGVPVLV